MITYAVIIVEVNTVFLKIRRIIDRDTCTYRIIDFIFFATWWGIKVILASCTCIYVWYIWIQRGHEINWILNGGS